MSLAKLVFTMGKTMGSIYDDYCPSFDQAKPNLSKLGGTIQVQKNQVKFYLHNDHKMTNLTKQNNAYARRKNALILARPFIIRPNLSKFRPCNA